MSGGVDSSVAALLLKQQGYDVVGISMRLYKSSDRAGRKGGCCTPRDMDDARRVCELLDIPYFLFDYEQAFKERVIEPFVKDYLAGRTPNPCVRCNQDVKFDILLKEATGLGCAYLATGHYAKIERTAAGETLLARAHDQTKDQSYFLFGLSEQELSRLVFPLAEMTKDHVRQIAAAHELPNHDKPDSQEICFVAGGSYVDVVKRHAPEGVTVGEIRDHDGRVIGAHDGYFGFTVGQRKGLGSLGPTPKYVLRVLPDENAVVVGDEADLFSDTAEVIETKWTRRPRAEERVRVKFRYRSDPVDALVECTSDSEARVRFLQPAKAVTPGQAAVFYVGDAAIGGGFVR
ncbi:MAG: tRNA 2-thiouridine(34) synthase MnmA [Deltaproteobacteria bacterium]|nr:tRNA 2-thiouridine(34) synthase MnmA [Deltaproteobacteria bacterium]